MVPWLIVLTEDCVTSWTFHTASRGEKEKKIVETLWLPAQLRKNEPRLMERSCLKEKG